MLPDLTPFDVRRIVGRDDALILEGGANEGDDTISFLQAFPTGQVECFDCDARAIEKWRRNITDPRATLYPFALAERCGEMQFNPSDGTPPGERWKGYGDHWDKSGSLLQNAHHTDYSKWLKFIHPVTVQAITIDCWASQNLRREFIDFVWLDLQGYEAMALRGARETLPKMRWIYCECSVLPLYQGQATLTELENLLTGFERVGQYGENYLWRNRGTP